MNMLAQPDPDRAPALRRTLARVDESREDLLKSLVADPASPYPERAQKAACLARRLQELASALQTPSERKEQAELERMVQSPNDSRERGSQRKRA